MGNSLQQQQYLTTQLSLQQQQQQQFLDPRALLHETPEQQQLYGGLDGSLGLGGLYYSSGSSDPFADAGGYNGMGSGGM